MTRSYTTVKPHATDPRAGMSLIEVLVAVAIMLFVALGVIPLFVRAIRQNREGANYTDVTNVARTTLESYSQLDFNATQLRVPNGSRVLTVDEYYNNAQARWLVWPGPATLPIDARFRRIVTVEQFTAGDLTDNGTLDNPLDGNTTLEGVQVKLIRVVVQPLWRMEAAFGRPTPMALELIKAL